MLPSIQPAAPTSVPPPPMFGVPPATESITGRRVAAGFIDLIPLILLSTALSHRDQSSSGVRFMLDGLNLLWMALIAVGYYLVCEIFTGTTPGKRLMGLAVVHDDGTRADAAAIIKRTLLRVVDGLPALYLVGFICMLTTPDKGRLGDMVAHTRVVSTRRATTLDAPANAARSGARTVLLVVVGAAALIAGVIGTGRRFTETPPGDRLGSFEVDRDMAPRIDEVMAAFESPTAEKVAAQFADGVTTTADIAKLLAQIDAVVGPYQGSYTIEDHRKVLNASLPPLPRQDVMQFKLSAEFEKSTVPVYITFVVTDGELQMVSWNAGTN